MYLNMESSDTPVCKHTVQLKHRQRIDGGMRITLPYGYWSGRNASAVRVCQV